MDLLTYVLVNFLWVAIALLVLYWIIRAAVLSALRTHHRQVNATPPRQTTSGSHLDADGL